VNARLLEALAASPSLGAIVGDFVGSRFERDNIGHTDFELVTDSCRFTDDSVLTVATLEAWKGDRGYASAYRRWAGRFPAAGYGAAFQRWVLHGEAAGPYGSYGNGAAMRVSPIGWLAPGLDAVLEEARCSAEVTHDHPEGLLSAQVIAGSIFMLLQGADEQGLRDLVEGRLGQPLDKTLAWWKAQTGFTSRAILTVPVAFAALLEGDDFESTLRLAVSAGGDSDTIASMAGALAAARWGIPQALALEVWQKLPETMRSVFRLVLKGRHSATTLPSGPSHPRADG